jgi:hypothetical protein
MMKKETVFSAAGLFLLATAFLIGYAVLGNVVLCC